jgi:hypothetical protein
MLFCIIRFCENESPVLFEGCHTDLQSCIRKSHIIHEYFFNIRLGYTYFIVKTRSLKFAFMVQYVQLSFFHMYFIVEEKVHLFGPLIQKYGTLDCGTRIKASKPCQLRPYCTYTLNRAESDSLKLSPANPFYSAAFLPPDFFPLREWSCRLYSLGRPSSMVPYMTHLIFL